MKSKLLLAISLSFLSACKGKPEITICILDPVNNELQCSPPSGEGFSLPITQAENYVCMSPDDTQALFNYIKAKCSK
jgi:hypothetical protein